MLRLFRNKRGVTPAISAVLMVAITVAAMLLVVSYSQTVISTRSAQMGEKLVIEKVLIDDFYIKVYMRNIGHGDLVLLNASINGVLYSLPQDFTVPSPEANPDIEPTLWSIEASETGVTKYEEGIYVISFISLLNKDLGHKTIEYVNVPMISELIPEPYHPMNDGTPTISAKITDISEEGVSGMNFIMRIDGITVIPTPRPVDNNNMYVEYDVTEVYELDDEYHTIYLSVTDSSGNSVSKEWWFLVDTTPLYYITGVNITNNETYSDRLDLEWYQSVEPDRDHYEIWRATSLPFPVWPEDWPEERPSFEWQKIEDNIPWDEPYYIDGGLPFPSTTYYYVVIAVDEAGNESGPSEPLPAAGKTASS
jgi:FlaG/FlaF family flagellin (archaellin)